MKHRWVALKCFFLICNLHLPARKLVNHNQQYHMKVLLSSFHLNGHTLRV